MRIDKYLADMGAGTRGELRKSIRKNGVRIGGELIFDPGYLLKEDGAFDVDTLVLHDGTVPLAEVNRAAKAASKNGSVLVATTAPKGRSWKNLIELKGGAAQ